MAVLIEFISFVVRRTAIEEKFPGGWQGFVQQVPNRSLCVDDDFARIGFMSQRDAHAYKEKLQKGGLVFQRDGQAVDFAIVTRPGGPTLPAPWLVFGLIKIDNVPVGACWSAGQSPSAIAFPTGRTKTLEL